MGEYKIKIRDTLQEGRYVKEQENQPPLSQTKEELIDFLIRNKAYPYCSKTGKIFFRRLKKAEDENTDFEGIIKNGAIEKLGLQTEEDFDFNERLHELNEELERLNAEAHELEVRIAENVVKIQEGVTI